MGRFRRSHLVPVPTVESYEALNRFLLDKIAEDDLRRIDKRPQTILEDWAVERLKLLPLPVEPFATAETSSTGVDAKGTIRLRTNRYSVPIRLALGITQLSGVPPARQARRGLPRWASRGRAPTCRVATGCGSSWTTTWSCCGANPER